MRKSHVVKVLPNMTGVRTDEQLEELLHRSRNDTVKLCALPLLGLDWVGMH